MTNSLDTHCENHPDDLAEFVLGQLEPGRQADVDAHLAICASCVREVTRLAESWSLMAYDSQPQAAPSHIMEEIHQRIRQQHAIPSASSPAVLESAPLSKATVTALPPGKSDAWISWNTVASYALAASVLIGLAVRFRPSIWNWQPSESATTVGMPVTHNATELEADLQKMARLQQAFGSPTVRVLSHYPSEHVSNKSRGTIVWDLASRQWHFFAIHLDPLPPSKTYMLWWINRAGIAIPAAQIQIDENGNGKELISLPAEMDQMTKAIVTLEPNNPGQSPSEDIYMSYSWGAGMATE